MNSILFFARFPLSEHERADGEVQRVLIIDRLARSEGYARTYVHLQFRSLQARVVRPADLPEVEVHLLSVFNPRTWPTVVALVREHGIAYFHSLHNYKFAWLLQPWLKRMRTVLDLHGVVPEENAFLGQPLRAVFYGWLEKRAMRRMDRFVSVSLGMTEYLAAKYPFLNRERIFLLPMVRGAERPYDPEAERAQRIALGLPKDMPVAIYSGNTQKWQNIDMMLDLIAHCGGRMRCIILSGAADDFRNRLRARGIADVLLHYATQDDIHKFYSVANYGFLLRDDNVVNNVANPTKLVEYLKYGIIPVVITEKTGDLEPLQVELLRADDMGEAQLSVRRSARNMEIFGRHYRADNFLLSRAIWGGAAPRNDALAERRA